MILTIHLYFPFTCHFRPSTVALEPLSYDYLLSKSCDLGFIMMFFQSPPLVRKVAIIPSTLILCNADSMMSVIDHIVLNQWVISNRNGGLMGDLNLIKCVIRHDACVGPTFIHPHHWACGVQCFVVVVPKYSRLEVPDTNDLRSFISSDWALRLGF